MAAPKYGVGPAGRSWEARLRSALRWSPWSGSSPANIEFLPVLLSEGRYTSAMIGVVSAVWCLSLAALLALWFRRPHSVIERLAHGRALCVAVRHRIVRDRQRGQNSTWGFMSARIYRILAASFVLAVLLVDNVAVQAKLAQSARNLHAERPLRTGTATANASDCSARLWSSSNDAIVTKTLDGTITGWNSAAEHLFGFTAAEAIGRRIDIIVPAGPAVRDARYPGPDRPRRKDRASRNAANAQGWHGRVEVTLGISPIRTPSGAIVGASKTARDIGESKRTREALFESEQLARGVIDTALDAFVQIDENGRIVDWNPQAEAIFGWSRQDALGQNVRRIDRC